MRRTAESLAVAERAGVHPGRLAELREDSTDAEVLAEAALARRAAGQQPATLAEAGQGDTLMVSLYGKEHVEARVELVGRTYVTAGGAMYNRTTGQLKGQYTGSALTVPEYRALQHREQLVRELRTHHIEVGSAPDLTVAQLDTILAVVTMKAAQQ